ncbi:LrgB family protein [Pararhodospirillum photometricum]|uniref:LrgB-like protein n=1 Tax=Pararhodospirillum photometricum DSM 122 TaxID=1150469 RepID=H6SKQ9_PARPM|nr:LrgB family protein [Pararhodospirillum photometricum]CCG08574.1 LrgB-like protein [Pararhodospirillum photometricum DSM 122]
MQAVLESLWAPLAATPLVWLVVTLAAFVLGRRVQTWAGNHPLATPAPLAMAAVALVLVLTGTSYDTYASGAQFITFLLGPTTIALAIPLARHVEAIRKNFRGIFLALLAGSLASIASGVAIVILLGGSRDVALSMAPKAATTPIAMAVAQEIGGVPALSASLAILGGVVAAITGPQMLHRLKIRDWRAQGLAAGVAGSGLGAAQVASRHELAAAFGALGIGLNGLLTALVLPLLARFL